MLEAIHPLAQRNNYLYRICQGATSLLIGSIYHIEYCHEERLLPFRNSPFILLPKHQSFVDIPLEGRIIQDILARPAYYVMKTELPNWFRLLGGIKITRPKDLLKKDEHAMTDREQVRAAIEQRNEVFDCIRQVYDSGEAVVVHPEGERNYQKEAPLSYPLLNRLTRLKTKDELVFIPLDIKYSRGARLRNKIVATIGAPIATRNTLELEDHLLKEVRLLSRSQKER